MLRTRLRNTQPGTFLLVLLGLGAATAAHAQTFSVLYNFGSQPNDPCQQFYSGIIAQGRGWRLRCALFAM